MFGTRLLTLKRTTLSILAVLLLTSLCSPQLAAQQQAPVADAGPDQIARPGQAVQLDGSQSHGWDSTIVAYSWTYVGSIPAGLPASLSDPGAVRPTVFIADAGTYIFQLVVTDDTGATSTFAQARVRTGPIANAGPAQTVKMGETVQLDGSASFDPGGLPLTFRWTLSPPLGSQARLSDSTSAKPTFVADVVGTYQAQLVTSNGASSSEADAVDITATTGTLSCGDLVSGSITAAGQVDQYTFSATASEILTLTLVDTSAWSNGPAVVSLFAPSGQEVTSFGANSQQQVSLSAAGVYVIQVVGNGDTSTGQYNLGLDCRNPNSPVKAKLTCGSLEAGSVTAPGQVNQYTFKATANEILTLTLVDTSAWSNGPAVVSLFAPSGAQVTSFGANSQQQVSLSVAGVYVIQVVGNGDTSTGQYNLGLVCRKPNLPVKAKLTCGSLEAGSITALGQVNQYTFKGKANEILTLTLVDTNAWSNGPAVVSLFAPSGQQVTSFGANSQQQVSLSVAGVYVIQVVGNGYTSTGQYNLGLDCRNPNLPVIAALPCGALQAGNITALGQVDQYTFSGTANEILALTLVDTSAWSNGPAVVSLFAPSGQQVTSFGANSQQQVSLSAAGVYVIQVVGNGYTSTGQYNLGLDCRNPNLPVIAALSCGALQAGNITALGQVDQYTFSGTANEILALTLVDTSAWSNGPAVVSLFAPSGQQVTSFGANSQQQVSLSAAGVYVIQVVGNGYTSTGQYNLGLDCRNPNLPVIAALSCGALQAGNISALGQVDQYTFNGTASEIVTLTLADTSGWNNGPAVVSLFAPSGQELTSFGANGQQQVTLPATGVYVIQVVGDGYTSTGQYNLGLECP